MFDVKLHNRPPCWAHCAGVDMSVLCCFCACDVCVSIRMDKKEHGIVIIFILTTKLFLSLLLL